MNPVLTGEDSDESRPFDDRGSEVFDILKRISEKRFTTDVIKVATRVGTFGRVSAVLFAVFEALEPGTVYAPGLDYEPTLDGEPPIYSPEAMRDAAQHLREEGHSDRLILELFLEAQIIEGPRRR